MCEDDFSRLSGNEILGSLNTYLSESDCPVRALPYESEEDMRFVYCLSAVKYILELKGFISLSPLDTQQIIKYIYSCKTYDEGFSWIPFGESHAGLSYCALSSLILLGDDLSFDKERYIETIVRK